MEEVEEKKEQSKTSNPLRDLGVLIIVASVIAFAIGLSNNETQGSPVLMLWGGYGMGFGILLMMYAKIVELLKQIRDRLPD